MVMKVNLNLALELTAIAVDEGFTSDGCTLAPELGIKRFCVMHDYLLEKSPYGVTRLRADNLFFQGICTKGVHYYPVAVTYWFAVRSFSVFRYTENILRRKLK